MIKSNKGNVEITGAGIDILTDLSMVIYALLKGGIPEDMVRNTIDTAIDNAKKEEVKEETVKKGSEDIVKKILKDLGIEV